MLRLSIRGRVISSTLQTAPPSGADTNTAEEAEGPGTHTISLQYVQESGPVQGIDERIYKNYNVIKFTYRKRSEYLTDYTFVNQQA